MNENKLISSSFSVFIDGREVTNFFNDGVQVLEVDSSENIYGLRCFWPFVPEVKLTKQQLKRLMREMKRVLRKGTKSVKG